MMRWLFLTLVLIGTVQSCLSPLQCNSALCADCKCVNGECACANGWSGTGCETPFCQNRTGCNNHGNCVMDARSITCVCDADWSGTRCEQMACNLKCQHGGTPNANCTSCVDCAGAWGGPLCATWDSGVPANVLLSGMDTIFSQSKTALQDLQALKPIKGNIGWGADIGTGVLTAFPVVRMTYQDRSWQGFHYPNEASVVPISNPRENCDNNVFVSLADYTNYVDSLVGLNQARNGFYSAEFKPVLDKYFNRGTGDNGLTVSQAQVAIYKLALNHQELALDKFVSRAVNSLPPAFDTETNKQVYRKFLETYGSAATIEVTAGGLLEQASLWASWLPRVQGFTTTSLAAQAGIDFTSATTLCGHSNAPDPKYTANRVADRILCEGGDPTMCSDPKRWMDSLLTDPIALTYSTIPLSELVADQAISHALQAAIAAYANERTQTWTNTNKCPPCAHGTTCHAPQQDACQCPRNSTLGLAGRTCSHCDIDYTGAYCLPSVVSVSYTERCQAHSGTVNMAAPSTQLISSCVVQGLTECYYCARDANGFVAGAHFGVRTPGNPPCPDHPTSFQQVGPNVTSGCSQFIYGGNIVQCCLHY